LERLKRDLTVGVSLNNLSGITGRRYSVADVIHEAREAEAMGFDAIWVHDAPQGRRTVAAFDPVPVLSAIAAVTERILLCTGIIVPHLRNPVSLAATWAAMDEISGGRSVMGVGTGAGKPALVRRQFDAAAALKSSDSGLGERLYEARGRVFEESLEIIRRLWREDKVSYEGQFYSFTDVTLGDARPATPPPVLIGAGIYYPRSIGGPLHHDWHTDKAGTFRLGPCKRIARLGDGWITPHATPTEYEAAWKQIQGTLSAEQDKGFIKAFNAFVNVHDDKQQGWTAVRDHLERFHGPPVGDDVVDRWALAGPPELIAERIQQYIDAGASVFQLVIGSDDQHGQMKLVAERVLPLLRREPGGG
jgi:coenzyme F420-dependent glucose-6-phosphate dehydrogenase